VPVAVNISSLEFRNEKFLEGVRGYCKEHRLDP
jgi:EAL domain-containing protein (putative c-di-GMP-specific phosphodiesterase class I)